MTGLTMQETKALAFVASNRAANFQQMVDQYREADAPERVEYYQHKVVFWRTIADKLGASS
jgi:hypothetical protein